MLLVQKFACCLLTTSLIDSEHHDSNVLLGEWQCNKAGWGGFIEVTSFQCLHLCKECWKHHLDYNEQYHQEAEQQQYSTNSPTATTTTTATVTRACRGSSIARPQCDRSMLGEPSFSRACCTQDWFAMLHYVALFAFAIEWTRFTPVHVCRSMYQYLICSIICLSFLKYLYYRHSAGPGRSQ